MNWILRYLLFFSLLLFLIFCKQGQKINDDIRKESFSSFYQKFHTDSSFQMERIIFPLPGINTDEMTVEDTVYYWSADEWEMHKQFDQEETDLKVERKETEKEVVEKIYEENSGFIVERRFELINGKWFLTYYANVNL